MEIVDGAHGWAAGDLINGDSTEVNIPSWADSKVSNAGFVSPGGTAVNTVPSAPLLVWLCNPNSLKCVSHSATSAPGPYNPRLLVMNIVGGNFAGAPDTIAVLANRVSVMKNTVSGDCRSALRVFFTPDL